MFYQLYVKIKFRLKLFHTIQTLMILPKEGFSVTIIKLIYKIIRQNTILTLIIPDHE